MCYQLKLYTQINLVPTLAIIISDLLPFVIFHTYLLSGVQDS